MCLSETSLLYVYKLKIIYDELVKWEGNRKQITGFLVENKKYYKNA